MLLTASAVELQLKRSLHLDHGSLSEVYGRVVSADLNSNGLQDFAFFTGSIYPHHPPRWEVWECRPYDRYAFVHADTAPYPYPPGIQTGFFRLFQAGDYDRDALPELWGFVYEQLAGYAYRDLFTCMESSRPGGYPDTMAWYRAVDTSAGDGRLVLWADDLDRDGRFDLVQLGGELPVWRALRIWENSGDNRYDCVWDCVDTFGLDLAIGDFDSDNRTDLAYFGRPNLVRECRGDNQYDIACQLARPYGNSNEVWPGADVTQNGKPEFWTGTYRYLGAGWRLYLSYWEATGDDQYDFTVLDSVDRWVGSPTNTSACGDVDGDGIEEVLWATGTSVLVYAATAPGQVERVATLSCSQHYEYLCVSAPDLDGNGYNEVLVGGGDATDIFEVEAVRLLAPNGGERLYPGDTCSVTWRVFSPPRCDSVSLFLRTDSSYRLDTIATGLAPADTPYAWVVPEVEAESARVMAIAYGPGWQFDESDGPIVIRASGLEEGPGPRLVQPWRPATVWQGAGRLPERVSASLLDPLGRKVTELRPGPNDIRHLAPGVYFLHPSAGIGHSSLVTKVIIQH